jgi:uncharacterized protein YdeI (YjbR/CyaY-like superfamily)
MGTKDARVDAYIKKAPDFAKPILTHLREVVHSACPDVVETMKWSVPFFDYKGPFCNMASFKEHCAFGFWKSALVLGKTETGTTSSAGSFGRITKVSDLPSKQQLTKYVKLAMKLNDEGVKVATRKAAPKKELPVPPDLAAALQKNKKAMDHFNAFSPSQQREYIEWIVEAKGDETRQRRLETTVAQSAEGKSRHWKYHKR